jgi:hypothetical protein
VPGGSEEVVLYLDILHALKAMGIPVYNDGHAVERSVDKYDQFSAAQCRIAYADDLGAAGQAGSVEYCGN